MLVYGLRLSAKLIERGRKTQGMCEGMGVGQCMGQGQRLGVLLQGSVWVAR